MAAAVAAAAAAATGGGGRRDRDDRVSSSVNSARHSVVTTAAGDGFRQSLERAITARMQDQIQIHRCGQERTEHFFKVLK